MNIYTTLIAICWAVFLVVWGIGAFGVKKDVRQGNWKNRIGSFWLIRIAALAVIVWGAIQGALGSGTKVTFRPIFDFINNPAQAAVDPAVGIIAVVLCAAGIGFAIWARVHLGRNWSSYPTRKEDHALVTSGPYKYVRHPIYTGVLFAILGTVVLNGVPWLVLMAVVFAVFFLRIRKEEKIMTELFPNRYPEYKKRTKALIPFVF